MATQTLAYSYFNLMMRFDGSGATFFYDLCAVDLQAALADVHAAYGEGELVQYSSHGRPSMYTPQGCSSIVTVRV